MAQIKYKELQVGDIIMFHGAYERVTAIRCDGPSEFYPGEMIYSFDLEPYDDLAKEILGAFYSHGTYGGVGFLTTELITRPDPAPILRNWIERAIGKQWRWPPVNIGVRHGRLRYEIDWADGSTGHYFIDFEEERIEED